MFCIYSVLSPCLSSVLRLPVTQCHIPATTNYHYKWTLEKIIAESLDAMTHLVCFIYMNKICYCSVTVLCWRGTAHPSRITLRHYNAGKHRKIICPLPPHSAITKVLFIIHTIYICFHLGVMLIWENNIISTTEFCKHAVSAEKVWKYDFYLVFYMSPNTLLMFPVSSVTSGKSCVLLWFGDACVICSCIYYKICNLIHLNAVWQTLRYHMSTPEAKT